MTVYSLIELTEAEKPIKMKIYRKEFYPKQQIVTFCI